MTDGLAEPLSNADAGDTEDKPDNVVALRARVGTDNHSGHPSGPRTSATRSAPTDPVDRALSILRSSPPSPAVVATVARTQPNPRGTMRAALAVLALGQLGIGLAWLVGDVPFGKIVGNPTPGHLSRDAALGVVLGAIGLMVAWRPRWSLSLVPVVGAIVAVQVIGLAADASSKQSGFHFEFPHVIAIIIGILMFLGSRPRRCPQTGR